jgi:hypothetical protein
MLIKSQMDIMQKLDESRMQGYTSPKSSTAMAGSDVMNASLQIAKELYNDGMQKQFFFFTERCI